MGLETAAIIAAVAAAAPAIYGIGKDILGPGQGDIDAAGAKKIGDMQKAATAYGAYRPDQADARMKAMAQQLSAFQGAGNIMNAMYGGSGGGGGYTPGGGGYKVPDPPPGGFNEWDPVTGTYKQRPGGPQTGWPQVIGGMVFHSQAEYDAWKKATQDRQDAQRDYENQMGVPKGTPVSPPIYVPPTSGGIGAGTSGTSIMPTSIPFTNPMAMSLAGNRTR